MRESRYAPVIRGALALSYHCDLPYKHCITKNKNLQRQSKSCGELDSKIYRLKNTPLSQSGLSYKQILCLRNVPICLTREYNNCSNLVNTLILNQSDLYNPQLCKLSKRLHTDKICLADSLYNSKNFNKKLNSISRVNKYRMDFGKVVSARNIY